MRFRVLLLLILGHLIGDFILQFKYILNKRFSNNKIDVLFGNLIHSLIHLALVFVFLLFYLLLDSFFEISRYLKTCVLLVFFHFCIDTIKSFLVLRYPSFDNNIFIFILDQVAHIIVIVLVLFKFDINDILTKASIFIDAYPSNINIFDKYLIISIIVLLTTCVTGIFIKKFINYVLFKNATTFINRGNIIVKSNDNITGINNGGYIIGILERIIILLGMAIMQPGIAGFVLTTKSIARFKKLDNNSFVEYFIIGTFLSFISAIIGGIIIYSLNIIPVIK
ncbi:DUF3307 domain-containing protein [Brassicibacter mesophilus]|uniref:DUF3307 domain-containing protein n=1 Tax=Brassicibacter mesophilus TaxID=745119 RepID=UPI003D1F2585